MDWTRIRCRRALELLTMKGLLAAAALPLLSPSSPPNDVVTQDLLQFREASEVSAWRPVLDGVMGGQSTGTVTAVEGAARFEGRVSLENNGGFASFRLDGRLPDLSAWAGLRLRVRGDGQVYKLSLRLDDAWDGVSWQAPFATTDGAWTTVEIPFDELVPSWRGRLVPQAGPFDPARILQIGVVIADKQAGGFRLDLASVGAWRPDPEEAAQPGSRAAAHARTRALQRLLDGGAGAAELARALESDERVFAIATPDALDAQSSRQAGQLLARAGGLADRELRLIHLMGERSGRLAGRQLTPEQVRGLRERWELPAGEWTAALIGVDGGVKARWAAPVEVDAAFGRVDAMPMRQREVDERGANRRSL